MSTLAAKKLNEALDKAKDIGLIKESFIIEDCEVTLRNLRPEEYVAILQACEELDDVSYLHVYQTEHLARSITQVNGMDLQGVKYIEEEEPDPKNPGGTRIVKTELHSYLLKHVVNTWGKEAVYTAYRKFLDVVEMAERKAKEGIEFLLPDETDEEKYRRLLLEAKESEGNLPDSLIDHILEEQGFMRRSTTEEVKAATERIDRMAREDDAAKTPEPKPQPKAEVEQPKPQPKAEPKPEPEAARQPMNRATPEPTDPHQTLEQAIEARRVAPSQSQEGDTSKGRTDKIAALEAEAGRTLGVKVEEGNGQIPVQRPADQEVAELRKQEPVDTKKISEIIDRPPAAGINPRFKPPAKV